MNTKNILKNGDIVSSVELKNIITRHGGRYFEVNGQHPEAYTKAEELGLEETDTFQVHINYGHEVQFHLISDKLRVIIETGLKGKCSTSEGWYAECQ